MRQILPNYKWKSALNTVYCLTFESFNGKLSGRIADMIETGERFTEDELWYLANSMINAMAYLQKKNIPVGEITSNDII